MTPSFQSTLLTPEWAMQSALPLCDDGDQAPLPIDDCDTEDLSRRAVVAIYNLFNQKKIVCVAFSGGKDSSVLMHLTVHAATKAQQDGLSPRVIVMSSDTGVENPMVAALLKSEHKKINSALEKAKVEHRMIITRPSLATSWQVRVIGGNKLPTFPGQSKDCSWSLKISGMERARKILFDEMGQASIVTLIGTRYDESSERKASMLKRGELAYEPYANAKGELVMSPIAFWKTDNVWEKIGLVKAGQEPCYSDFEDLIRVYADAGGTSCAVVSDAITEGLKNARSGCGARHGCWTCQMAGPRDKSLENMLQADASYSFMEGLNALRNLIAKYRWDFSRRYWVMRSITPEGTLKLTPDCYSPNYLLELFRYAATLDAMEVVNARKDGVKPRFQILCAEEVVAIDAMWSLNGFHPPHTALLEWLAISSGRVSYAVPEVGSLPVVARLRVNHEVEIPVGTHWDGNNPAAFTGMRNALQSLASCAQTRTHSDGREIPLLETADSMSVDLESMMMALDFEMEGILERHNKPSDDWTDGYRFWVSYGTLTLAPQQVAEHDNMLRRTQWRARNGFLGEEGNLRAQEIGLQFSLQAA